MSPAAANPFQKATKAQLKARVAFEGPTGAGKTWTALEWATVLVGDDGRIAFIDTERGSASLYSDHFDFDVLAFEPPYDPGQLVDVLRLAEQHGYAAVVIDSLSHFWEGEGGTLDMVDAAAARSRSGNKFSEGWKVATPALRHLVDTMLGLDAHLLVTMRSKMEYVLEENDRGQKVPRKVGLAPVMRAGVEYEFTLVGDLDHEHRLVISKSRCDLLADEVVQPGRAGEAAEKFSAWLGTGEPLISPEDADALAQRLNALPGPKRTAYRNRYTHPKALREAQLAEVLAFVADLEQDDDGPDGGGTPAPDPEPEASGPDGPGVADREVREAEQAAGEPDAHPDDDPAAGSSPTPETSGGGEAPGDPAPTTDVQDLVDLVKDLPGYKRQGAREAKLLQHARTAAHALGVDPPSQFKDLSPGPVLNATYELVEQIVEASGGTPAPDASDPSDGDSAPSSEGEPASREQTQQALIARIADSSPRHGRERHDAARHALIRHVTQGRTESSREASKDELLQAHRVLDEVEAGTVELYLRANGEYEVRARRGTAA